MDLQSQKLELINWLINLEDESIISRVKGLMQKSESINEEELQEIKKGQKDIEAGRFFSHEEVMNNLDDRFAKLLK